MNRIKKSFYVFLLILGGLGLTNTLVLLFYTNKSMGTMLPGIVGILFMVYASLKLWIYMDKPILRNRCIRGAISIGIVLFVFSFLLLSGLVLYHSDSQQAVESDYLIILGASVRGDRVSLTLKERLDKGIEYMKQYPQAQVIVSGGQGFEEYISEAEAMRRYLVSKGTAEDRILMEPQATSTMENFQYTKKLLASKKDKNTSKIVIITSDFHMFRAKLLARRSGFEAYGITCSTPASVQLNNYMREYFALIKSYLFDWPKE